jgi:hypothetical protein
LRIKKYLPLAGSIVIIIMSVMYLTQGSYLRAAAGFFVGLTLAVPYIQQFRKS